MHIKNHGFEVALIAAKSNLGGFFPFEQGARQLRKQ